jgi:SAM-dependent methyltransferase
MPLHIALAKNGDHLMNMFLKTRKEIDENTASLQQRDLIPHNLSCKNWDIGNIIANMFDGNLLDMGCMDSYILQNAVKCGFKGKKFGIDLGYKEGALAPNPEINYSCQDLMKTNFESNFFDYITCLSVIEHEVDFEKFAQETSRLLRKQGKLFVTFDYWNPKIDTSNKALYNLKWQILDKNDVENLVSVCSKYGLCLDRPIDWTVQDAIINPSYCSPFPGISYTFGILIFIRD